MTDEIRAIIEKNLPAQVGEVLKTRLEQAEKDVIKIKQQEETLQSKNAAITQFEKLVADYKTKDEQNAKLEARELAVTEAERNLKIATLEYQLVSEKEKTDFTKNVALGLVRNTEFRKTIFDSENQGGYMGPNGVWVYPTPINKVLTEDHSKK